jgi:hypothetical protein
MIGVAALGALLGLSFWLVIWRPHQQHLEWYRDIEEHIIRLADRRPEGVSPSRWAYCLSWTWQLHTNCGGYEYFDRSERTGFLAEFDRRLTGTVDLGTIDWIWDEYVEHSTCGRGYSRKYRPTDPGHLRDFLAGKLGHYDLQEWLDRMSHLPTRGVGTSPKATGSPLKALKNGL